MHLSVPDFWNSLVDLRVADAATARNWATECAAANDGSVPSDARKVAKWLLGAGHLSEFQLRSVLAGRGQELLCGPWVLRERIGPEPFRNWSVVQAPGDQSELVFDLSRLPEQPSSQFLKKHLTAQSPWLMPLAMTSDRATGNWLESSLKPGDLLANKLVRGSLDSRATLRLAAQLSAALTELHRHGLAAQVHSERVWVDESGQFVLLRDPVVHAENPFTHRNHASSLDPFSGSPLAAFAAPEFAVPGIEANPTTDVYALGCVLYLARTGDLPFSASDTDQWVRAHAKHWPESLNSDDDPAMVLIRHCLAKNLDARFVSAKAVNKAVTRLSELSESATKVPVAAAPPAAVSPAVAKSVAAVSQPSARPLPPPTTSSSPAPSPPLPTSSSPPPVSAPQRKEKPPQNEKVAGAKPVSTSVAASSTDEKTRSRVPPATMPASQTVKPLTVAATSPSITSSPAGSSQPPPPQATVNSAAQSAPPSKGGTPTDEPKANEQDDAKPTKRKRVKKKVKKKNYGPVVIGAIGFAMMMIFGAVLISTRTGNSNKTAELSKEDILRELQATNPPPVVEVKPDVAADGTTELTDDPRMLWAPPGSGEPILLDMLPSGTQTVFMLRPARMLASGAGRSLLAAFDAELKQSFEQLQTRTGVAAGQIDRLFVALDEGAAGEPIVSLSVKLVDDKPLGELRKAWGKTQAAQTENNQVLFVTESQPETAYYVAEQPPNDAAMIRSFAIGSVAEMKRVAEVEGSEVLLPPAAKQLWTTVREGHDLAFMVNPNLLFAGGRNLLKDNLPKLVEPLKALLVPDVSVGLVTMSFEPQWFSEIRVVPGGGSGVVEVLSRLQNTIDELPQYAESFLINSNPHDSWRPLAFRMKDMFGAVAAAARVRADDQQAVANFYLPQAAASNVLLAGWLAANTQSGNAVAAVVSAQPAEKPLTVADILQKKIKIDIAQEDLHAAIAVIAEIANEDTPPGSEKLIVRLVGNDLEKGGITQNQAIRDFSQRDVPFRQALTALCMKANTPPAKDPTDPDQKLVWAFGPDPMDGSKKVLLITTRVAAETSYELAAEFVPKPAP